MRRAFPDDPYAPIGVKQAFNILTIPLDRARKLALPEVEVRLRHVGLGASFVAMPKAAIGEKDSTPFAEYEIGRAGKCFHVFPETQTSGVKRLAKKQLRFGVLAANARHHSGSNVAAYDVSHPAPQQMMEKANFAPGVKPSIDYTKALTGGTSMSRGFAVVDLFAGPGGLGEGFSAAGVDGGTPMSIRLSVEKDPVAVQTLRLRAFLRSFDDGFPDEYYEFLNGKRPMPDWRVLYPENWALAEREALQLELGVEGVFERLARDLDAVRDEYAGETILIGGPPCQAYSLAGRSRNLGIADYVPEKDDRHFLYREYVRILDRLRPAAFVMENVKGLLSSKVGGGTIFKQILEDLSQAGDGYVLIPVSRIGEDFDRRRASNFLVRAEDFGVPQARHRVLVIGIRRDRLEQGPLPECLKIYAPLEQASVEEAVSGLPSLRSGLSRGDSPANWSKAVTSHLKKLSRAKNVHQEVRNEASLLLNAGIQKDLNRVRCEAASLSESISPELAQWLSDEKLDTVTQHETRGHIREDLGRYLFAALFAKTFDRSPKLFEFPEFLQPAHKNRKSGAFADRFRVQRAGAPSTTVTSHISKDGHYYIHPDAAQCRSLTVREAARLQTFPDNYFFQGPRTEQYRQVGNAVPPFLAKQIAVALRDLLDEETASFAEELPYRRAAAE